ncbi:PQQ-dependent sugar dehydrogenase [Nocardia sp. NPDC088792]|uniref:PQQ-dependent sugar dehydrogenase n=1 Tax=Nocardia sp. NPDC088792 TaxID=3364332 RepID=UPI0037FB4840
MSLVAAGRVGVGARKIVLGVTLGAVLLSSGCASFDDRASSKFTAEPTWTDADQGTSTPKAPPSAAKRPDLPCVDPDPLVVVSCLDTTGGIVALPDGTALVAERTTGRILKVVATDQGVPPAPVEVAKLDVDPTGDGGITALTLSPSFGEDGLIYAYITTASDNRVVRINTEGGGDPKPILTGIPKGTTGNRGSIDFHTPDRMLVLTGDAGNPSAAADVSSLAGKLLGINSPAPGSTADVMISGIGVAGGVCSDHKDTIWITDRTATEDRLQRVGPDGVAQTAWTWPDHPGVAGCAAATDAVAISLTNQKALALATADKDTHAVTAAPSLIAQDKYGRLDGATIGGDGMIWVATVNKPDGNPNQYDDRVVRIPINDGKGGGTRD